MSLVAKEAYVNGHFVVNTLLGSEGMLNGSSNLHYAIYKWFLWSRKSHKRKTIYSTWLREAKQMEKTQRKIKH